jgi:hypothetical protein
MRISLTPRTTEFFALFAKAGENALETARLVERRFREHPSSGVTQEQVKAELVAIAIALAAFVGRSWETRRLVVPATA